MKKADEIRICLGSSCFSRGNKEIVKEIRSFLEKHHLSQKVVFRGSHCLGNCQDGPNISVNQKIIPAISRSNIIEELGRELGINK